MTKRESKHFREAFIQELESGQHSQSFDLKLFDGNKKNVLGVLVVTAKKFGFNLRTSAYTIYRKDYESLGRAVPDQLLLAKWEDRGMTFEEIAKKLKEGSCAW